MESKYGVCSRCGTHLVPIWFNEEETKVQDGRMWYTGRTRKACSHLECPNCFKKECVDDSFDRPWY